MKQQSSAMHARNSNQSYTSRPSTELYSPVSMYSELDTRNLEEPVLVLAPPPAAAIHRQMIHSPQTSLKRSNSDVVGSSTSLTVNNDLSPIHEENFHYRCKDKYGDSIAILPTARTSSRSYRNRLERTEPFDSNGFWNSRMDKIHRMHERRYMTRNALSENQNLARQSPYPDDHLDNQEVAHTKRSFRYSGDLELGLPFDHDPRDRPSSTFRELAYNTEQVFQHAEAVVQDTMERERPLPPVNDSRRADHSRQSRRRFSIFGAFPFYSSRDKNTHHLEHGEVDQECNDQRLSPSPSRSQTKRRECVVSWGSSTEHRYDAHNSHDWKDQEFSNHHDINQENGSFQGDWNASEWREESLAPFYYDSRFWIYFLVFLSSLISFSCVTHFIRVTYTSMALWTLASLQFFMLLSCSTWIISIIILIWYLYLDPSSPSRKTSYLFFLHTIPGTLSDLLLCFISCLLWIAADIDLGLQWNECYGMAKGSAVRSPLSQDTCRLLRVSEVTGVIICLSAMFILAMKIRQVIRNNILGELFQ